MGHEITRRTVVAAASAGAAWTAKGDKPALLGGPAVRKEKFPAWPKFDTREDEALAKTLRSGKWFRGNGTRVDAFEKAYAELTGSAHCLAVANGTSALLTALGVLGVGPGDEVIVPPYTFIATVNAVLMFHATPVFCDTDPATFQMDPKKLEAKITPRTVAIIPVHMGGAPVDLDAILAIAKRKNIPVIEDAAQAHLATYRGKHVGTLGTLGCFSFQASKNLNSGEGGAVLTQDAKLADAAFGFHNNSRTKSQPGEVFRYAMRGANLRLTEFQGALLVAQMSRLEEQSKRREENAAYLGKMLAEIPGLVPARPANGATRSAWHLFMMRYEKEKFANLPRAKFLKALAAEGIPSSGGYDPLNKESFITNTLSSRGYERILGKGAHQKWMAENECPANDRLCTEAVWFTQTVMLAERSDMEQIAEAARKISQHAGDLVKG